MSHYICLCAGALFGYILGAIMATGANADAYEKEDKPNE